MAFHYFVTVLLLSVVARSSAYISTLGLCRNNSPECLKQTLQSVLPSFSKGSPDMDIESLDPFVVNKLVLALPGDLKIEFRQGISKGIRKCVIDSARLVNETLDLQVHCNFTIKGKYKSSGRLLMFAINGDGDSMIKCKDIKIQLLAKLGSTVQEDGKKHLEIKAFKSHHSFDGQVYYHMTNLIKGNPEISNLVVSFMNSNWRMVAEEFGKPIVDFGIISVLKNVKKFLKAVPQDQLVGATNIFKNK